jgi:hypothetical protein
VNGRFASIAVQRTVSRPSHVRRIEGAAGEAVEHGGRFAGPAQDVFMAARQQMHVGTGAENDFRPFEHARILAEKPWMPRLKGRLPVAMEVLPRRGVREGRCRNIASGRIYCCAAAAQGE